VGEIKAAMILTESVDYTPQIEQVIAKLKHRMDSTLVKYSADDIMVIKDGDTIHILANPVVGEEPLYDELGDVKEWIPKRNITALWTDTWSSFEQNRSSQPRLRILRPDLCMRILPDGTVDGGTELYE